jgi:hypothetical protein
LLTHPTVDQLVKLGLAGMARAFTEMQDNQSAAARRRPRELQEGDDTESPGARA